MPVRKESFGFTFRRDSQHARRCRMWPSNSQHCLSSYLVIFLTIFLDLTRLPLFTIIVLGQTVPSPFSHGDNVQQPELNRGTQRHGILSLCRAHNSLSSLATASQQGR
ncbi:hypothetical protein E2C01_008666 [Portunus trituberculatus]|uniref:Uncharacterized protein n=1 Tax=Portunus trituberculatus TaxID=210409 RepID=A0A5B7D1D7_PORTR|nr:hypothetical protein [Portunus trituberculatus]